MRHCCSGWVSDAAGDGRSFHLWSFLWNSSTLYWGRQALGRKEFLSSCAWSGWHQVRQKNASFPPLGNRSRGVAMYYSSITCMANSFPDKSHQTFDVFVKLQRMMGKKKEDPAVTKVRNAVIQPMMRHKPQTRGTTNRPRRQSRDKRCSSICDFSALPLIFPSLHSSAAGRSLVSTPSCQQSPAGRGQ